MELIKNLNENANASMDRETFDRFVKYAKEDIEKKNASSDAEMLDVIWDMLEDTPGFDHVTHEFASDFAGKVLKAVKAE